MESNWIWPFELLDKLGEGGMGVVYRARYVGNNRQVAVKLIPEELSANTTLLARFERELEVLKQLRHPNIVHCFGGRCESKQRYYAMELVEGGTLAAHLAERGPLAWETAVDFGIQMCSALHHAHRRGVIHRDVKPGNFLLTKSGQLKLSDFGLASVVAEGRLTAAGKTVGTILYMAPEQIRGGTLTPRVDLYALGCVMFEMLTGHTPFSGSSAAEVLQRHLKEPPPHAMRSVLNCPLELDTLIYELLSKDPLQRPVSAEEVGSRLQAILLPSRRRDAVEPNLFASLGNIASNKNVVTTPLKNIVQRDSEVDLPQVQPQSRLQRGVPWVVAAVAVLFCLQFWFGWANAASQLVRAEQTWAALLQTADTQTRVLAAQSLGKFDRLSPEAIDRLTSAATSESPDVRVAALKVLTDHAAESRAVTASLMRIQKIDDNSVVRAEAGTALSAIQRNGSLFPGSSFFYWLAALSVVLCLAALGSWVWKTVEPYAR